jgi:two-component system response regulator HydG
MAYPPQLALPATHLRLLVADPDAAARSACAEIATSFGFAVECTGDPVSANTLLRQHAADIVLVSLPIRGRGLADRASCDLASPVPAACSLIDEVKLLHPETSIIVMTTDDSISDAIEAMQHGAADYLIKPFNLDKLSAALERAAAHHAQEMGARRLREKIRIVPGIGDMIGHSTEMEKLYRILLKVSQSAHPVLILGESGTGKELVARTIHTNGPNAEKPFLPVDCGSIVPTLMESELFGYVKGAFTGANHSRDGLLVSAGGGTVFLDEIGELSLDLQAKLLRALQEREVRPVGATHRVPIKARILAATNRDLAAMVENGTFRKDLFYRLNVVNLRLPSLRDRREDIPLLAAHFLERFSHDKGRSFKFSDQAIDAMMRHDWPGNVRELENAIERACTMASDTLLSLDAFPTQLQQIGLATIQRPDSGAAPAADGTPPITPLAEQERRCILEAIRILHGDKLKAARLLGIGKTTLYRKLKEYGVACDASEA